jgi:hypothetical protein
MASVAHVRYIAAVAVMTSVYPLNTVQSVPSAKSTVQLCHHNSSSLGLAIHVQHSEVEAVEGAISASTRMMRLGLPAQFTKVVVATKIAVRRSFASHGIRARKKLAVLAVRNPPKVVCAW